MAMRQRVWRRRSGLDTATFCLQARAAAFSSDTVTARAERHVAVPRSVPWNSQPPFSLDVKMLCSQSTMLSEGLSGAQIATQENREWNLSPNG